MSSRQITDSNRWRISVAPMLNWTDRHCRYFHRLLSRCSLLYTEMVTTGALIHGDVHRHLHYSPQEQPLALQLGGSDPSELAQCARLGADWGYTEINLNCGCPSERVQRGAFGACLMTEPGLVADCVKAMLDVTDIAVTVKHRIGIDHVESYDFVRDFVGVVSQGGCRTFIVHARNAWLQGLSPKDNREVPALRYEWVYQLKRDFPHLLFVINGGVTSTEQVLAHLAHVDGVMLGREAYQNPWWLSQWDQTFFPPAQGFEPGVATPQISAWVARTRESVEREMVAYMVREAATHATAWPSIARHMLGLRSGLPGARHWRRVWSDHHLKHLKPEQVMAIAHSG
ncbi:tRNA-dihydrouridine synthase A [mine drainage metagenome]|uniref:tRNA-dihydrouridine synthase A n=1 Tax=mine drainage metagenome TaxID=410659 RepID=A0A1J5PXG9_9ZZZZ